MMYSLNNTTRRLAHLMNNTLQRLRPQKTHVFLSLLLVSLWATVGQAASRGPRRFVIGKFVQYCLGGNWDGRLKPCYGQIDGVDEIARTYKVLPLNSQSRRVDRSARPVNALFSEVQEIKLQMLEKYFVQKACGRRRLYSEDVTEGPSHRRLICRHNWNPLVTCKTCDVGNEYSEASVSDEPRKRSGNNECPHLTYNQRFEWRHLFPSNGCPECSPSSKKYKCVMCKLRSDQSPGSCEFDTHHQWKELNRHYTRSWSPSDRCTASTGNNDLLGESLRSDNRRSKRREPSWSPSDRCTASTGRNDQLQASLSKAQYERHMRENEACGGNTGRPDSSCNCNSEYCTECSDRKYGKCEVVARPDLNGMFDNAYDAEGYRRRLRGTNNAADKLHRRQLAALKAKREH